MPAIKDYTGQKFGRLTVLQRTGSINGRSFFLCQCECGKYINCRSDGLISGRTSSCGCYHKEVVGRINRGKPTATLTHGKSYTRLYKVYSDMKCRCFNPHSHNYKYYGERGITICEEWLEDYMNFEKWAMENGYDENAKYGECTIDRINVNGNYEPSNCRWVSMAVQAKNKRPKQRSAS